MSGLLLLFRIGLGWWLVSVRGRRGCRRQALVGAGVAVDRERKEGGREEGREGEWSFTTFSSRFEICCRVWAGKEGVSSSSAGCGWSSVRNMREGGRVSCERRVSISVTRAKRGREGREERGGKRYQIPKLANGPESRDYQPMLRRILLQQQKKLMHGVPLQVLRCRNIINITTQGR